MIRIIDAEARLTLSLLKDYLNRLENEMEGEVIWEDRPYAERVEQAIVDTKDTKAMLEALLPADTHPCEKCDDPVPEDEHCGNDRPDGSSEYLCPDCYVPG